MRGDGDVAGSPLPVVGSGPGAATHLGALMAAGGNLGMVQLKEAEGEAPPAASGAPGTEHTTFVKGTFSNDDPGYYSDDVKGQAHDLLGSTSGSDFEYFGGPNDETARAVAGRKLYQEEALPAAERGQKLNLVAHSHGGNVVGEMGAHMDEQEGYLGDVQAGARAPKDSPEFAQGVQRLEARLAKLLAEKAKVEAADWSFSAENAAHKRSGAKKAELLAYLDGEIATVERHHQALLACDDSEVARELELLRSLDLGDVILLNTPYMDEHPEADEQGTFMEKADGVHDFQNPVDPVVAAAHERSGDQGNRLAEGGAPRDKVHEHEWTLAEGEGPTGNPDPNVAGGIFDPRGRAQHGALTDDAALFEKNVVPAVRADQAQDAGKAPTAPEAAAAPAPAAAAEPEAKKKPS
ncbi:MAG: hypothetical protein KC635_25375 [Myxococcales bacterium]|nr:hypothetical protein [Myxococcales bacterium]